jgi:hypothetical protein
MAARFYYVVRCPTTGYTSERYATREGADRKVLEIARAGTCSHHHTVEEEEVE